jgi:hypothetical protein
MLMNQRSTVILTKNKKEVHTDHCCQIFILSGQLTSEHLQRDDKIELVDLYSVSILLKSVELFDVNSS